LGSPRKFLVTLENSEAPLGWVHSGRRPPAGSKAPNQSVRADRGSFGGESRARRQRAESPEFVQNFLGCRADGGFQGGALRTGLSVVLPVGLNTEV